MIFTETNLKGAFIIEPELIEDERGFFARVWTPQEFEAHGLNPVVAQCNISQNRKRGTLRGMHYQIEPHAEAKLVRCTRGAIYDVAVDLRPDSPTFRKWTAVELSAANRLMFYIPEGFAHGYQTLEDDTELYYQVSQVYAPDSARGVRWNDPTFDIKWPEDERTIIARDQNYPDFVSE